MEIGLLNYDEAVAYEGAIADRVTRELVGLVLSALSKNWIKGDRPVAPLDVLFVVKTVEVAFAKPEILTHILSGGTTMWPET